ncbi:uncharacterized protein LOC108100514 [Drosophila ficusphila]|uniref:uncharacterized protein LOC108100514 n=1 Tax=Drosophila ficusphila TaxID=30025 RepID=UPI0007E85E54|nr:uncharacterized protein LOC108100514 [Drosophila ficusphila]
MFASYHKIFRMKFLVVTLFITLHTASAYYKAEGIKSFPVCGNCSHINNFHINPGFICHYEDEKAISRNYELDENLYAKCVPNSYVVTRAIDKFCCFWSPELGCSVLIGRRLYDKKLDYCAICKRYCTGSSEYVFVKAGSIQILGYGFLFPLMALLALVLG